MKFVMRKQAANWGSGQIAVEYFPLLRQLGDCYDGKYCSVTWLSPHHRVDDYV